MADIEGRGRPGRPTRTAVVTALVLVASSLSVASPAQGRPRALESTSTMTGARLAAARSGRPVEVADETTETTRVMAQPDGSFVLTSSAIPVRVKQHGTWHRIDTTLRRAADGSWRPTATTEEVAFSGGGSAPAVTLTGGGGSLAFVWPTALPAPTVSGASATYASVLPGVDLVLTARASSYGEVLVVHDAAAAADPRLRGLRFGVRARGLRVRRDADGGLSAVDTAGKSVFHGSPPVMWDSSHAAHTASPTAQDPGTAKVSPLALALSPALSPAGSSAAATTSAMTTLTTMTLTPAPAALTGRSVHYPVFIDPALQPNRSHFAVVTTNGNWHYYDDTSNDLKVGYCNWSECNGSWRARTYLAFDTAALGHQATTAQVSSAKVEVYEIHNAHGCTSEPVDLYTSGAIGSSTDWPGPIGSKLDETSSHLGNTCNSTAGMVTFSSSSVTSHFQSAANGDTSTLYFGLRSPDENNAYQWKRFSSAGGSSGAAAQIEVHYDFPPSTPSGLSLDNTVNCSGQSLYTRDTTPTVHAHATDYNTPHLPVGLHFGVYSSGGSLYRYNPTGIDVSSGATASWSTNSSNTNSTAALNDGSYKFDAYATSTSSDTPDERGATSGFVNFVIDHTAPATPTIGSFDYPQRVWGTAQGGTFTFTGSSDTAGFAYAYDSAGAEPLPTDTTCSYTTTPTASGGRVTASSGKASVTLPTLSTGYHTLYVRGFDHAHNVSGETAGYVFYVAPTIANEGFTRHEAESYPVTASGTACDSTGCPTYTEPSTLLANGMGLHLVSDNGSTAAPATFTATSFTVNVAAEYAVDAHVYTQNHFGILEFELDGKPLTVDGSAVQVDTYSPSGGTLDVALGGRHLEPGSHTLTYLIVGKNPASVNYAYHGSYGNPAVTIGSTSAPVNDNGYSALIDYVRVVGVNNPSYTSLFAARNNNGIAIGGSTQADIGPYTNDVGLDQTAMAAAGFGPNADVTVDAGTTMQTTFHIDPDGGKDNVIAMGQTVPLPTDVVTDNIDLLVTSTCGATAYVPSIQLTVNFADGTYSSTLMPVVSSWTSSTLSPQPGQDAAETLVLSMNHITRKTGVDSSYSPNLFHVSIPTKSDHSSPVHSITLPNLGSDLSENCTAPSLHVFALSTHTN